MAFRRGGQRRARWGTTRAKWRDGSQTSNLGDISVRAREVCRFWKRRWGKYPWGYAFYVMAHQACTLSCGPLARVSTSQDFKIRKETDIIGPEEALLPYFRSQKTRRCTRYRSRGRVCKAFIFGFHGSSLVSRSRSGRRRLVRD
jgi:hypothetical protein